MGYLPMSGNEHFHRGYSLRPHKSKSLINHGIISRCCRDAPSSVSASALRAASEAIDRQNMPAVHALRTGTGGNDPQRVRRRDNAKAWRRDVDREYHLHYWETGNGTIEFASIGVHNDFTIPE